MIIDDFKIRNFLNHYEDVKECLKKKKNLKLLFGKNIAHILHYWQIYYKTKILGSDRSIQASTYIYHSRSKFKQRSLKG